MNLFLNKIDVTMIIQTDSDSAHIWVMKNGNNIQNKKVSKQWFRAPILCQLPLQWFKQEWFESLFT